MAASSSSVPVWLTMGFAGGLVFAFVFLRSTPPPVPAGMAPPKAVVATKPGEAARQIPLLPFDAATLGEVQALFQAWGGYAIWKGGLTQFAVWNRENDAYTDFYEVRRVNRIYYFRTLPKADWPLIDHGETVRCPLWFAETPEMREKYYREHPEVMPGEPIRRSLPARSPLLPPLPPAENGQNPAAVPVTPSPALTPGAGS